MKQTAREIDAKLDINDIVTIIMILVKLYQLYQQCFGRVNPQKLNLAQKMLIRRVIDKHASHLTTGQKENLFNEILERISKLNHEDIKSICDDGIDGNDI